MAMQIRVILMISVTIYHDNEIAQMTALEYIFILVAVTMLGRSEIKCLMRSVCLFTARWQASPCIRNRFPINTISFSPIFGY